MGLGRGRIIGGGCYALAVAMTSAFLVALLLAPMVSAQFSVCQPGSGPGQCDEPRGIAVDLETGRVYVADRGNHRIDVFGSAGNFLFSFGEVASGAGQLSSPKWVAVDNDSTSAFHQDIYVTDESFKVQRFDSNGSFELAFGWGVRDGAAEMQTCGPQASPPTSTCLPGIRGGGEGQLSNRGAVNAPDPVSVGAGGVIYVGDVHQIGPFESEGFRSRIEEFEPSGAFIKQIELGEGHFWLSDLSVDSDGEIYTTFEGKSGLHKYHSDGSEYGEPYPLDKDIDTNSIALDKEDNLFASQVQRRTLGSERYQVITAYGSNGNHLRRFGYGEVGANLLGLAAYESLDFGDVLGSESGDGVKYFALPPEGPNPAPPSLEVMPIGSTNATLNAEINPEGEATEYRFEYITQEDFEEGGVWTSTPTLQLDGAADFELHRVQAVIGCSNPAGLPLPPECLDFETKYRYRVVASNPGGLGTSPIEGQPFETGPPIDLKATWSSEVGVDAARLSAEVIPLGISATGFFEYVDDAAYQANIDEGGDGFAKASRAPVGGSIDFGSGATPVVKSTTLFPLVPATTYHYRLNASNVLIDLVSDEHVVTTFPKSASVETDCSNEAFRGGLAAFLPDCRAYEMVSPLEKGGSDVLAPPESPTFLPASLEQSSLSGDKLSYASYGAFFGARSAPYSSNYIAARDSLAGLWRTHAIDPPQGRPVIGADGRGDTVLKVLSPDLCQAWMRTVAEPPLAKGGLKNSLNLYRRLDEECGGESYEALTTVAPIDGAFEDSTLELQGLSADGTEALYVARDTIPGLSGVEAPDLGKQGLQLYERSVGQGLRFICVLPGGAASHSTCSAGTFNEQGGLNRNASVHNAISTDGTRVFWTNQGRGPGAVFVRENPFGVGAECAEKGAPCTIAVSESVPGVTPSVEARFWGAARDGSKAFFSIDDQASSAEVKSPLNGNLYEFDVADEEAHLIAHQVVGIAGISEDATRVYFGSEEALSTPPNAQGKSPVVGEPNLYFYQAGEGGYAFIATLTDADVVNKRTPLRPEPIHNTARITPDGGHLAFTSFANPTGYDNTDVVSHKPDAEVYLYDAESEELVCGSCNPSGARPAGRDEQSLFHTANEFWVAGKIPVWENTLYASRVLSEDGARLFFESTDKLSARDTNGKQDVYQWEALGMGDCKRSSPYFSSPNGGCVSLISSGKSDRDAEFRDASPDGDDVFFGTLSSLLPQDYGLIDIYDARVAGGLPTPPLNPPPCEGDACQDLPLPPPVTTLSSSAFEGAGNVKASSRRQRCPRGKHKVKGRCVAKHKGRNRHRRAKR